MPMQNGHQQGKSWDARNYILAALGGSLAATAMVIIVSVILSPARMSFSITNASCSSRSSSNTTTTTSSGGAGVDLRFTVSANTRQRRGATKVKFLSLFVSLANGTSESSARYTTDASLDPPGLPEAYLPVSGPDQVIMSIDASVHLLPGDLVMNFAGPRRRLVVEVTSVVRFRIGVARTRTYDVKVTCPGVVFRNVPASMFPADAPSVISCNG